MILPSNTIAIEDESGTVFSYFALDLLGSPNGCYETTLLCSTADDDLCVPQRVKDKGSSRNLTSYCATSIVGQFSTM